MKGICFILCSVVLGFFSDSPKEASDAISFINENKSSIHQSLKSLSSEEQLIAISIVAPEISQFSSFQNFLELRTLFVMYLNTGQSDFSVGYFQMKPSFIELMEKKVKSSSLLTKEYKDVIPKGSMRAKRKFRLERLGSLQGQLRYLKLFIDIVKINTSSINFNNFETKLKYWATLYNSGLDLQEPDVLTRQGQKLFPRYEKKYNYSSIALEFYHELKKNGW